MNKTDFILEVLANNLNVFTNPAAMKQTIIDIVENADQIYDEAQELLKKKGLLKK